MINSHPTSPPPLRLTWFVWGLGALFYLLGFFQRVAPAVMTGELMRDFQIGAGALGNLSAFYFYSYVGMQIPTGILADVWGPRRLLGTGAMVAAIGTAVFALAPTMAWAALGRLLIGGSFAVAFVGMLKITNNWFPPRYFAMVSGVALCCGMAGAVFAGTPLRMMMDHTSWRTIMLVAAVFTAVLGAAMWLLIKDYPHDRGYADWIAPTGGGGGVNRTGILAGIAEVFRYRNTWLLFVIPAGVVGTVLTFSGLWGVPFLTTHYHLPAARSAVFTSTVLITMALGGLLFGWLSDHWGRRKPVYMIGVTMALAGWVAVLMVPNLPFTLLVASLVVAGLFSGSMIISFAFAKESVPQHLSGTISGVINMGVMMGPMLLQPVVGWILDHKWQGGTAAGIRLYSLDAYQTGFAVMLAWLVISLALLFFTRETHCRQVG
jgi:MFS family permease